MKITKRQLRRIIREEKQKLIAENPASLSVPASVDRERLAVQASDEALREIQKAMGITDGGVAGQWPGFDKLVDCLTDYIMFEEHNREDY